MFEGDVIIPAQFYSRGRGGETGVRLLMQALIKDAIDTLEKYCGVNHPRARRLYQDAIEWIDGAPAAFTFEDACAALGFDAAVAREAVHKGQSATLRRRLFGE